MQQITIPFDGFYESFTDDAIDLGLELLEEENEDVDLSETVNFGKLRQAIAEKVTSEYNEAFKEAVGIDLKLKFLELDSPREYNFSTDAIFVSACPVALKQVVARIGDMKVKSLLREAYKPQSGYNPFTTTLEAIESGNYLSRMWGEVILPELLSYEDFFEENYFSERIVELTLEHCDY